MVDLPAHFSRQVEGVCGNFDCLASNDYNLKGGVACTDPTDLTLAHILDRSPCEFRSGVIIQLSQNNESIVSDLDVY